MSTAAQISANQLNAQSSTGPRTAEGKSVVSQNATKHGLTATYPVIRTPEGRGRDTSYPAPPAQIRTGGFPAYGSYLG